MELLAALWQLVKMLLNVCFYFGTLLYGAYLIWTPQPSMHELGMGIGFALMTVANIESEKK